MDNVKQNQYQNLTTAVEITCGMYKQFERLNSSTIKYNENLTKSFELLNATLTASYNYVSALTNQYHFSLLSFIAQLLEVVRLELNQSLDMERNNASAFVELHQKWQGALVELRNKGFKSFLHPIFNISDYILMGLEN